MKAKISRAVNITSGAITIVSVLATIAASGSMIARNKITDMLLAVWWLIPLLFLAVSTTLYSAYAGSLALLEKGLSRFGADEKDGFVPARYLFMMITAVMESWAVVLLRYLIVCLLRADGPWTKLSAAGCAAACGFILLAFIVLLPGSVIYGSWEEVCDNTDDAPLYLVTIGLLIEAADLIVWCAGRYL